MYIKEWGYHSFLKYGDNKGAVNFSCDALLSRILVDNRVLSKTLVIEKIHNLRFNS